MIQSFGCLLRFKTCVNRLNTDQRATFINGVAIGDGRRNCPRKDQITISFFCGYKPNGYIFCCIGAYRFLKDGELRFSDRRTLFYQNKTFLFFLYAAEMAEKDDLVFVYRYSITQRFNVPAARKFPQIITEY